MSIEYCYSENDEDYRDHDISELFQQMMDNGTFRIGAEYWRGEVRRPMASDFFDADTVLEQANECAYEVGSEWSEDFGHVSEEAKAELDNLLSEWANKHCTVNFYEVHAATKMSVTAEEYAEYADADYQPDDAEAAGKEAQKWHSANRSDPFPPCHICYEPSCVLSQGKGFCGQDHLRAYEANKK